MGGAWSHINNLCRGSHGKTTIQSGAPLTHRQGLLYEKMAKRTGMLPQKDAGLDPLQSER